MEPVEALRILRERMQWWVTELESGRLRMMDREMMDRETLIWILRDIVSSLR